MYRNRMMGYDNEADERSALPQAVAAGRDELSLGAELRSPGAGRPPGHDAGTGQADNLSHSHGVWRSSCDPDGRVSPRYRTLIFMTPGVDRKT